MVKEISATEYIKKICRMHSVFDWLWGFTQIFLAVALGGAVAIGIWLKHFGLFK